MLCRGNACLKRQRLSAVLDNVSTTATTTATEEPLLFLYPRGFPLRGSIAPVKKYLSTFTAGASAGTPGRSSRASYPLSRPLRGPSSSVRWISSGNTEIREQEQEQEQGQDENQEAREALPMATDRQAAEETRTQTIWEQRRRVNLFADIQKTATSPLRVRQPQPTRTSAIRKTHLRPLTPNRVKAIATVKLLMPRDRRRLRHREFLKNPPPAVGGAKQDWRKWSQIRNLLDRIQKDHPIWVGRGLKHQVLMVPEETVALVGGVTDIPLKENVLYANIHHGVRIHIRSPSESEGHLRKMVISGSRGAVREVSERILGAQRLQANADPLIDVRKPPLTVYPSIDAMKQKNMDVPRLRGVWDFYRAKSNLLPIEVLLESGFHPETPRELLEFIEDMLASETSGPYRRQEKGTRRQLSRNLRIEMALVKMFRSLENRKNLSTASLNKALSYLSNRNLRASRAVFARAEHVATVDSFNILLKSCAKRQDIRLFIHLVHSMSRLEIRPDAYTWVALLNCPITIEVKLKLFAYIYRRGFLSQVGPLRSALQSTIADILSLHLDSGKSMDSFLETMQNTHGANWFTPSMINQMLYVAAQRKNKPALFRLLEVCDKNGLEINCVSLMHVLPMYRSNPFDALLFLYPYITRPGFKISRQLYEKLFLIAFKSRSYNICRVLWRYACMNGTITYKMKMCVLSSMTTNIPLKRTSLLDIIWLSNAGKVIVGVDLHCKSRPGESYFLEHTPPQFHENPIKSLITGFTSGEDRERQLQLVTALVRRDIELGRRYRSIHPLAMMLDAAALVDAEWRNVPHQPDWMLKHAVMVPVEWQGFLDTT